MVVLVVLGVLTAIAVPIYSRYVRNSRLPEATGRLADLLTAARSYASSRDDNGDPRDAIWPENCNVDGFLGDCSESRNFRFRLEGVPNGRLRVEAIGKANTPVEGVRVAIEIQDPADLGLPAVLGM